MQCLEDRNRGSYICWYQNYNGILLGNNFVSAMSYYRTVVLFLKLIEDQIFVHQYNIWYLSTHRGQYCPDLK